MDNYRNISHSIFASCVLLICRSPPSCDAKPRIELPDHCRHAAKPQPHSHWQPAKQYGQPDARHDGPVPSSAVLSGNCNNKIGERSKQILKVLTSKGIYGLFWPIFSIFCYRFLYHNRRTSSQCWCPVSRDREQWPLLGCSPAMVFFPPTSTPPWGTANREFEGILYTTLL